MNNVLYTIGHSRHPLEHFLELLRTHSVEYVADVRSMPYSKFAPDYNKEQLKRALETVGVRYFPMGKAFGARQEDESLYCEEGYLDFSKVRSNKVFVEAKARIIDGGIKDGKRIALMCTEKDPIDCHRAIMVAKAFYDDGVDVEHILENGILESQSAMEQRLLDMYFPRRNQVSIFETSGTERELIEKAYKMQNEVIGYRPEKKREFEGVVKRLSKIAVF